MKKCSSVLALVLVFASNARSQTAQQGLPVDQTAKMGAPNYATRTLSSEHAVPSAAVEAPAGAIVYHVTFVDPYNSYSSYFPQMEAALQAAGAVWAAHLSGSASIEVEMVMDDTVPTANGASVTTGFVRNDGTRDIFEPGAAYELRTGSDPNGADPDIRIRVGTQYLLTQLWFDPDPASRTAVIPPNQIDAISVFTHELGHSFTFNGYTDGMTGAVPPTYEAPFDANVNFDGTNFFFVGSKAVYRYGGPVPLTFGNIFHFGNNAPRPGSDLLPDLMNGVVFYYQTRYYVSGLDLEVARDNGLAVISPDAQLLNISTRLNVGTTDNVLIGGLIITGNNSKELIFRATGPSLTAFGVDGALADPILELHDSSGALIATNDNWKDTQEAEIMATGLAPSDDLESALLITLDPGNYTVVVQGKNDGTGVGLVEGYDLTAETDGQLANISTRGLVGTDDGVMIGGVIAGPVGRDVGKILVRAIGPSLAGFGIANPLQDPVLELHDGNGAIIASNDDWKSTQEAEIEAAGLAPSNEKESALIAPLAAGNYTAVVRGANNTSGVSLVEVYSLL